MAVFSNMLQLGTKAPDFNLFNPKEKKFQNLNELKSDIATVIMFICNHCPYVKHLNQAIVDLVTDYQKNGISFIAINSNDAENYPEDSPEKMVEYSEKLGYNFPYLYDEDQTAAKNYLAACTPDFYIFDNNMELIYRGQFDDSRPSNGIKPSGKDLRNALDSILRNEPVSSEQIPSIGCSIKWKK